MSKAETYKRIDEPTPSGGAYSVIYYRDTNGKACREAEAVSCEIVEYDENNEPIQRIYGSIEQPREYSRYMRRLAMRYAQSQGYNPKKLRYRRKVGNLTVYPIVSNDTQSQPMAIVIDEAGNAHLQEWPECG